MIKTTSQESIQFPGFFHVPMFEDVLISRDGKVIDLTNMFCPLMKYNREQSSAYPYVYLPGYGTTGIHRLLALTFLDCPGNPTDYHVNHIDGRKWNYDLDNLEWATPSQNAIHAYATGLRYDNRPVVVKDLRTEECYRFNSLQETARWFDCNAEAIHRYLNTDDVAPFRNYFTLIYEGEVWKPLTAADVGRARNGRPKAVLAVMDDGRKILYESTAHAGFELDMKWPLVAYYATGNHQVKGRDFSLYYVQDYLDGVDTAITAVDTRPKSSVPITPRRKPVPVNVRDNLTGVVEWWESVEAFARSMGSKKNTVQKSMYLKAGVWKHYLIEYCDK